MFALTVCVTLKVNILTVLQFHQDDVTPFKIGNLMALKTTLENQWSSTFYKIVYLITVKLFIGYFVHYSQTYKLAEPICHTVLLITDLLPEYFGL